MKESFIIYTAYAEKFKRLTDAQFGQLIRALIEYQMTEQPPEIADDAVSLAFDVARYDLDQNAKKYEETCEKRREAGEKGGRPKKANGFSENQKKQMVFEKANGFSENQTKANETKQNQSKAKKPDNDNDNDNENENENDNENERESARTHEEPKKTYGLYNNVRLTDGEMQALIDNYPDDYPNMIENLSAYMKEKGKFYADHYATMTRWRREDEARKKEQEPPKKKPLDVYDFFISSALKA